MSMIGHLSALLITGAMLLGQGGDPGDKQVEFFKEEITMTVTDSTSAISGVYYFRNNTEKDKPFSVAFPLYVDDVSQYPYQMKAYMVNDGDTLVIEPTRLEDQNAVRLRIPMKPKEVTIWHLDYAQRIGGSHATYILTSTAAWGQPLEEALYRFVIPADFEIIDIWPKVDKVRKVKPNLELWCEMTDFMPSRDMEIYWQRK
jgi:hypothetical protein